MNNSDQDFDILISGAGFTGLTLASALAFSFGKTLKIGLVGSNPEQYSEKQRKRAFAIAASSAKMLDVLGLWKKLKAYTQPVYKIEITDSALEAGVRPVLLTYNNTLQNGTPASFIVPAQKIAESLLDNISSLSTVEFLPHKTCSDLSFSSNNVSVEFDCGARVTTSLLLCAEGRDSNLRKRAGIGIINYNHKQTGIVTNIAHEEPHDGTAIQHFLPAGPFASLPLPGGKRSAITWSENDERASLILEMQDRDFLEEVDKRMGGKLGAVSLDGPRSGFSLKTQLVTKFVIPRFALVGDSAHSVHPIAGQGLNLAFRDIAVLCECISDGKRIGLDVADLTILKRYERWRRFDATCYTNGFVGLNLLFSNNSHLFRTVRQIGLTLVNKLPDLKSSLVREASGTNGRVPKLMSGISP
ncbi:MAG: FAD-dependent monooxygenase [Hyphomicrobiaceae bacterium]|nr:FAD-dependent monooxygenase [Hyphomicrobiaceae bacterium]